VGDLTVLALASVCVWLWFGIPVLRRLQGKRSH
jgi:hypothetical protein